MTHQGTSFRTIFVYCQAAEALLSLSDVVLAMRLNVGYGIPDSIFVLGSEGVATVLGRITLQPFLLIAARLCPAGCEASLYAFFMSTHNFGHAVSGWVGASLLPAFGVTSGAYDHLPALLMLRTACMFLPMFLVGPLLNSVEETTGNNDARKRTE